MDNEFFEDHPTKVSETDIFEMTNTRVKAEIPSQDEDGETTAFAEVVKFFKDPHTGKFMRKFAQFKIF